jgi:hypothetical protein
MLRSGLAGLTLMTGVALAPHSAEATGLQLSATSGAARSRITVALPSCATDGRFFREIDARLLVGPSNRQKLAGFGKNAGWGPSTLIVPDWPDPNEPAAVEATCISTDRSTFAVQTTAYGPVPFDVLPSSTRSTQTSAFNRTTLKVGQSASVSGTGCTEAGAQGAVTGAFVGSDPTGRQNAEPLWGGAWGGLQGVDARGRIAGEVNAEASRVDVQVLNWQNPAQAQLAIQEIVRPTPPGPYVAFTGCENSDGTVLMYKPKALSVTPNPAVEQSELVAVPNPPMLPNRVRLSGQGCNQSTVTVDLFGQSLADIRASLRTPGRLAATNQADVWDGVRVRRAGDPSASAPSRGLMAKSSPLTAPKPLVSITIHPDPAGNWSYDQVMPFTDGFVAAKAMCGNPLGNGFEYHEHGLLLGGPGIGQGGGPGGQ